MSKQTTLQYGWFDCSLEHEPLVILENMAELNANPLSTMDYQHHMKYGSES